MPVKPPQKNFFRAHSLLLLYCCLVCLLIIAGIILFQDDSASLRTRASNISPELTRIRADFESLKREFDSLQTQTNIPLSQ